MVKQLRIPMLGKVSAAPRSCWERALGSVQDLAGWKELWSTFLDCLCWQRPPALLDNIVLNFTTPLSLDPFLSHSVLASLPRPCLTGLNCPNAPPFKTCGHL